MTSKVALLTQWHTSILMLDPSPSLSGTGVWLSTISFHFSFSSSAFLNTTGTSARMFCAEKAGFPTRRMRSCTWPSAANIPEWHELGPCFRLEALHTFSNEPRYDASGLPRFLIFIGVIHHICQCGRVRCKKSVFPLVHSLISIICGHSFADCIHSLVLLCGGFDHTWSHMPHVYVLMRKRWTDGFQ